MTKSDNLNPSQPDQPSVLISQSSSGAGSHQLQQRTTTEEADAIADLAQPMSKSIEVVILGPNLPDQDNHWEFHVHVAGCTTLDDPLYDRHAEDKAVVHRLRSLREATLEAFSPSEFGYDPSNWPDFAEDLKVCDCVRWPGEVRHDSE
ncbi:hypothetical protein ACIBCN_19085 [Nocardia sp. NPDC051052]|uniref:hypothetical protein n=1 Tax=Nocardia sp. NPDC051052 TaxID=3364322 RepID=UPI00379843F5